ncbi:MAG: hypothetical protein FJ148_21730 [Deltaproteobacteria bacterium]|nr:hypothetical protein [Deltaproteobacteria bacterium]
MKVASSPDRTRQALGILFPLAGALRANRVLRVRRPEMDFALPVFRDNEIAHWQAALDATPSLGAVIDQVYEQAAARGAAVAAKAQRTLSTAALVLALFTLTASLPAMATATAVSPWLVVAAAYAFTALLAATRAVLLDRPLAVELDALADPITAATATRGEAAIGVLLLAVRARRAAAVLHNRVAVQASANLADAAVASLRNAFVALAAWLLLQVVPAALADTLRWWGSFV